MTIRTNSTSFDVNLTFLTPGTHILGFLKIKVFTNANTNEYQYYGVS